MTNEEVIEQIKILKAFTGYDEDNPIVQRIQEALDMAIKALDRQPCEDWYDVPSDEMTLEQARQAVKDLRKKLVDHLEQEPKTGHWIDDKCSICGKGIEDLISSREWYRNEEPNFCPFCGIKIQPYKPESEDKE